MKTKDRQSLREKGLPELEKILGDMQKEIVKTKTDMFRGKIKNLRTVKSARVDVSRIKTWIREKQLKGATAQ